MTIDNQARQLLLGAALCGVLLLMATPAAQADPLGNAFANPRPVTPVLVNSLPQVELGNAPKPEACFLSVPKAWADFATQRPHTPAASIPNDAGGSDANDDPLGRNFFFAAR
jgi:hypothetical protein